MNGLFGTRLTVNDGETFSKVLENKFRVQEFVPTQLTFPVVTQFCTGIRYSRFDPSEGFQRFTGFKGKKRDGSKGFVDAFLKSEGASYKEGEQPAYPAGTSIQEVETSTVQDEGLGMSYRSRMKENYTVDSAIDPVTYEIRSNDPDQNFDLTNLNPEEIPKDVFEGEVLKIDVDDPVLTAMAQVVNNRELISEAARTLSNSNQSRLGRVGRVVNTALHTVSLALPILAKLRNDEKAFETNEDVKEFYAKVGGLAIKRSRVKKEVKQIENK